MIDRKKLSFVIFNSAWAIYFALWALAHMNLCRSLDGSRLAVEILLIFQNLSLIFFFVFRHPPKVTSWKPLDIAWSTLGGFGQTLFWSTERGNPHLSGIALQILGSLMVLYASLSLGRSWGVLPANRRIQTKGMYRFIRHPIYASYQVALLGYLINQPSFYNIAIGIVWSLSQILRIFAEERLLAQDPEYLKYRERVRWRMIPYIL